MPEVMQTWVTNSGRENVSLHNTGIASKRAPAVAGTVSDNTVAKVG